MILKIFEKLICNFFFKMLKHNILCSSLIVSLCSKILILYTSFVLNTISNLKCPNKSGSSLAILIILSLFLFCEVGIFSNIIYDFYTDQNTIQKDTFLKDV